jgi:hypothetical protein
LFCRDKRHVCRHLALTVRHLDLFSALYVELRRRAGVISVRRESETKNVCV